MIFKNQQYMISLEVLSNDYTCRSMTVFEFKKKYFEDLKRTFHLIQLNETDLNNVLNKVFNVYDTNWYLQSSWINFNAERFILYFNKQTNIFTVEYVYMSAAKKNKQKIKTIIENIEKIIENKKTELLNDNTKNDYDNNLSIHHTTTLKKSSPMLNYIKYLVKNNKTYASSKMEKSLSIKKNEIYPAITNNNFTQDNSLDNSQNNIIEEYKNTNLALEYISIDVVSIIVFELLVGCCIVIIFIFINSNV